MVRKKENLLKAMITMTEEEKNSLANLIVIGIFLGVVIGQLTGNNFMWVSLGAIFGTVVSLALSLQIKKSA